MEYTRKVTVSSEEYTFKVEEVAGIPYRFPTMNFLKAPFTAGNYQTRKVTEI